MTDPINPERRSVLLNLCMAAQIVVWAHNEGKHHDRQFADLALQVKKAEGSLLAAMERRPYVDVINDWLAGDHWSAVSLTRALRSGGWDIVPVGGYMSADIPLVEASIEREVAATDPEAHNCDGLCTSCRAEGNID